VPASVPTWSGSPTAAWPWTSSQSRPANAGEGRAVRRCLPVDFDPATLLPTGCAVENGLPPAATPRLYELEARDPDFNAFTALAHGVQPAASLSGATGGDLDRSRRQRELRRPNGFGDELRAALVGTSGTWGALTLVRDASQPHFTRTEVGFVSSVVATPSRSSVPTRRS
jgi:hypothetical protein